MSDRPFNVLFLCTGNSARSIMAEGMLAHLGRGRFAAHSAGSHPNGVVNPAALSTLAAMHIPTDGFRSKSWDEFARPDAPALDFVITVCDNAAGETCPLWPGQPVTAHWGVPDPAAFQGSDEQKAKVFMSAALTLRRRIELMLALPLDKLSGLGLQGELRRIGSVES
jgi:arsenate reductase (thioredoxin)